MEAEKEQDPFASIIKLCQPTASQEAKFPNCPLARESENFADSNQDQFSSSADPTPSEPTGIVMVSPPGSSGSVHQQVEDDVVFHTPPEHHLHSHLSSSEDQNLDEICAERVRTHGRCDGSKKVRVSERGLDDESDRKKIKVLGEEFDGETVPVGETEVIVVDSADSGEKLGELNLADDSLDKISDDVGRRKGEFMRDGVPEVDPMNGNRELGKNCESLDDILVNTGEKPNENSYTSGSLNSSKIEAEIVKLKCIVSNGGAEMRQENVVGGTEKFVKVTEEEKSPKTDGKREEEIVKLKYIVGNGCAEMRQESVVGRTEKFVKVTEEGKRGPRTDGKRIQDIDEFRYVGGGDVKRRWKGTASGAVDDLSKRRQLPVSLKDKGENVGGENLVEKVESKSGLVDFLNVLKVVFGDTDGACEDVDFLETAKRRGLTFPRARWWSREGDDE